MLTIPCIASVHDGGERKQYQVLIDPNALTRYGVTLKQVEEAVAASNVNGTGGYLDRQGPSELLVRTLGRLNSIEELASIPVTIRDGRPILLRQVASVREGAHIKRGDSSAFVGESHPAQPRPTVLTGGPAVVLTINKQPGADTRRVTDEVFKALSELKSTLPQAYVSNPVIHKSLYRSGHHECRRGPAGRCPARGHHLVSILDEFAYDLHHPDRHTSLVVHDRYRVRGLSFVDKHHDLGRHRRGHGRTGR